MCGLIGYYCFGDKRPNKSNISNMLIACASRGTDATGIAFVQDGKLNVIKHDVAAWDFVGKEDYKKAKLPKILIGHCRATTQGHEKESHNNHPVFSKSGVAITHNGMINNDEEIFEAKKYLREGAVDSEIILRVIEEKINDGIVAAVKNTSLISGSFAVGMISRDHPEVLTLFKHSNPIVIAYDTKNDILYYGSTKEIIIAGFTKNYRRFVFHDSKELVFLSIHDDSCIVVNKKGLRRSFMFYDESKNIERKCAYDVNSYRFSQEHGFDSEATPIDRNDPDAWTCMHCQLSYSRLDIETVVDSVNRIGVCAMCDEIIEDEKLEREERELVLAEEMAHNQRFSFEKKKVLV